MDKLIADPLQIQGAYVVTSPRFEDARGILTRLYEEADLKIPIAKRKIVSINLTITRHKGMVRGLHYQQQPNAEMKMVRCLYGRVWDVIVDIREGSSTFLKWESVELSKEKNNMIIVPEGVAHGFQALENNSELLYLHTAAYAKEFEGGFRCDDPAIGIKWPLTITELSDRDKSHPLIDQKNFKGIRC